MSQATTIKQFAQHIKTDDTADIYKNRRCWIEDFYYCVLTLCHQKQQRGKSKLFKILLDHATINGKKKIKDEVGNLWKHSPETKINFWENYNC